MSGVSAALDALAENEAASAYSAVILARRELEKLADVDAALRAPAAALASLEIELRETETTLQHYRDRIEADPARLSWLDDRLARIRTLARRHGVAEDELPARAGGAARAARRPRRRRRVADDARKEHRAKRARCSSTRRASLSGKRAEHAAALGQAVSSLLVELGMPHGELRVELQPKPLERADATGLERVEFQVKLNPGLPFAPLAKVASGGELSRISLAVEVVRSGASPVTAFVFDEVDAGIGGRVADIVGRKLRELSATRQVLCVTHLPQVASHGEAHYRVVKQTDGKIEPHRRARADEQGARRRVVADARRRRGHGANARARRRDDRPGRSLARRRLLLRPHVEHETVLLDVVAVPIGDLALQLLDALVVELRHSCPVSRHTM